MKQDHYSVLGVAPTSEQVVIRAAYRALMRRYHPDADPGEEAAERARAINAAYAVLSNPEKRASYDDSLAERKIRFEPALAEMPVRRRGSRLGPAAAIGFSILAAGMVAFAISPPALQLPVPTLRVGGEARPVRPDQPTQANPPAVTASKPAVALDSVPKEPDPPAATRPVRIAAAELPEPVRLPREAAAQPRRKPSAPAPKQVAAPAPVKLAAAKPRPASSACAASASRAQRIICGDNNLSSLDRQLTMFYRQSWNQADERKRAALLGTRQRFNDRRDACGSPNCMTTAYVSRLREISDIMAGRSRQ